MYEEKVEVFQPYMYMYYPQLRALSLFNGGDVPVEG